MMTHAATRRRVAPPPQTAALIAVLTLLLFLAPLASAAAAAPDNDDFANARAAAPPLPYLAQQNSGDATVQPGDPDQFGSGATVWYRFTAPADMVLVADTVGSGYDTTLGAYTGAHGALTEVAANDDAVGVQSRVAFRATAGVTYHFMVGAFGGGPGGSLTFRIAAPPAPGNDAYSGAVVIPEPLPFLAEQSTLGATASPDDPACADGRPSVWYRFTPTQDVLVTADAFGGDHAAALSVVTGGPGAFTEVVCRPEGGTVNFAAQAGVTYYLLSTPVESGELGGTVRVSVRRRVVRYSVRELPTPAGFANSAGNALNNGGTAVGQTPAGGFGNGRAVVWVDGAPVVLGVLGPMPGGFLSSSVASAVNESGTVVGTSTSPGGNRAAVFLSNGAIVDLGVLGPPPIGQPGSSAAGINNSGLIVGTSSSPGGNRAVAWSKGRITDLGFLGPPAFGAPFSVARAVNNRGMIVGTSSSPAGARATLWHRGEIVDLGVLGPPPFGVAASQAYAVNNPGEVVGSSTSPAGTRAFFWDRGEMTPLGVLPGQEPNTGGSAVALGINNDRVIVGNSTWIGGQQRAVVWTGPASPAEDLNDLVPPLPVVLFDARAVNDSGDILAVGGGRTYLLTPAAQP